jgi:glycerate kinase
VRVLLAPDKFKGSLTALQVAQRLRRGLESAGGSAVLLREMPVADGGDGTLDVLETSGFARVEVDSFGPKGEPVRTRYARRGGTAVVELAEICGMQRLGSARDPMGASTFGLGDVIGQALDAGAHTVVVGVGGSASTDGGAGLLQALGARLRDPEGADLYLGGGALVQLHSADLSQLHPGLADVDLVLAADVDAELLGPRGAAAIYAPQKGADSDQVTRLDYGLGVLARAVADQIRRDDSERPASGAAGGAGFGLLTLGARYVPGAEFVLDLLGFDAALGGVDLVVAGEGSLDRQSLAGKAPMAVARRAAARGVRVVAVVGRCDLGRAVLASVGIDEVYALTDLEPDEARSMANAAELVERQAARLGQNFAG